MSQHLFILQPQALVTGLINDSWDEEYPTHELPIMSVSVIDDLDFEDVVKAGMLVAFGSSAGGDDLGRQRIRRVFSAEELLIGRSSRGIKDGEVNVTPGDHFTIYDDFRIWSKVQWIHPDGTIFKDADITFETSGGGELFPPVANTGPGFADEIDPISGVITVTFPPDGVESFGMPINGSIVSYLWDFKDGTVISGSASSATATVTFPAGFRWVSLTVTDEDGLIHTARCPVLADDPDNSLCVDYFQVVGDESTQHGQQLSFLILSDIPRTTFLDGTLVMYWEDAPSSPADRSHMKFIGWHHNDSATIQFQQKGTLRDTVLECLDVGGKLDAIQGFAQIVVSKDVPTKWGEIKEPTMDIFFQYVLHWHTTALELADYFDDVDFAIGLDFYSRQTDDDTVLQQLITLAKQCTPDRIFTVNRQGQMGLRIDQNIIAPFNRTDEVQANLEGLITDIRIIHTRPPRVGWIRGSGVIAQWYPDTTTIEVPYTINVASEFFAGATSIDVEPIPVDLSAGAELIFTPGQSEFTSAPAVAGATTLAMVALSNTVDIFIPATVLIEEAGPSFIPTVFCISPGLTPGQGAQLITIGNKLVTNAAALQVCIGNWYERMNAEYGQATITLAGSSDLGIDPGLVTWVETGNVASRYIPQRALPFFPCRGLPIRVSRSHTYTDTGRVVTVRIQFERETVGIAAVEITGNEV